MNKKELNTILKLKYNKTNENKVIKALENMEDNLANTKHNLKEDKQLRFELELLEDDSLDLTVLNDEIEKNERIIENWIKPCVRKLQKKQLEFVRIKRKEDIAKAKKELKNSGK